MIHRLMHLGSWLILYDSYSMTHKCIFGNIYWSKKFWAPVVQQFLSRIIFKQNIFALRFSPPRKIYFSQLEHTSLLHRLTLELELELRLEQAAATSKLKIILKFIFFKVVFKCDLVAFWQGFYISLLDTGIHYKKLL